MNNQVLDEIDEIEEMINSLRHSPEHNEQTIIELQASLDRLKRLINSQSN